MSMISTVYEDLLELSGSDSRKTVLGFGTKSSKKFGMKEYLALYFHDKFAFKG